MKDSWDRRAWNLTAAVQSLLPWLVPHQVQSVVTHSPAGEYGHPNHLWTFQTVCLLLMALAKQCPGCGWEAKLWVFSQARTPPSPAPATQALRQMLAHHKSQFAYLLGRRARRGAYFRWVLQAQDVTQCTPTVHQGLCDCREPILLLPNRSPNATRRQLSPVQATELARDTGRMCERWRQGLPAGTVLHSLDEVWRQAVRP